VIVGLVQEANKPLDLVSGLFAEAAIARKISAGFAPAAMCCQLRPAAGLVAERVDWWRKDAVKSWDLKVSLTSGVVAKVRRTDTAAMGGHSPR
jgi:hypothetical protein